MLDALPTLLSSIAISIWNGETEAHSRHLASLLSMSGLSEPKGPEPSALPLVTPTSSDGVVYAVPPT